MRRGDSIVAAIALLGAFGSCMPEIGSPLGGGPAPPPCTSSSNCAAGLVCEHGVCCTSQSWYRDADLDGYGDASGTVDKGTAFFGCVSPAGFVADHSDCLDDGPLAALVHPHQTSWFATGYGPSNSFDYDCNGKEEPETPVLSDATCGFCGPLAADASTSSCASPSPACTRSGENAAFACDVRPTSLVMPCAPALSSAFLGAPGASVACGATAISATCAPCAEADGGTGTVDGGALQQRCH